MLPCLCHDSVSVVWGRECGGFCVFLFWLKIAVLEPELPTSRKPIPVRFPSPPTPLYMMCDRWIQHGLLPPQPHHIHPRLSVSVCDRLFLLGKRDRGAAVFGCGCGVEDVFGVSWSEAEGCWWVDLMLWFELILTVCSFFLFCQFIAPIHLIWQGQVLLLRLPRPLAQGGIKVPSLLSFYFSFFPPQQSEQL